MEVHKLPLKKVHKTPGVTQAESRFWSQFQNPILVKEHAAVTDIAFSSTAPHDFAVTSSARVQVYGARSNAVVKTIARFHETAYSGSIRSDGKLLVAGDGNGLVQVFDLTSRAILRTFQGHNGPVHLARFLPNNTHILTGSDDKTVRVWSIPISEDPIVLEGHADYVRAGTVCGDNPNLVLTGSYDHTIKLWDLRTKSCVLTMDHGAPVEDVIMLSGSGALVASAGANQVKIWDILNGGRLVETLANHQKTVTCLTVDAKRTRLLAGSLDHQVKVYSLEDYKVIHSIKYPGPILSLAMAPNDSKLVVGMASGVVSIRPRVVKTETLVQDQLERSAPRGGTFSHFNRGKHTVADPSDLFIESRRKKKLRPYEKLLKAFLYSEALDAVLATKTNPLLVMSMLEELSHRDGLRIALSGRDELSLEPLLQFICKHIANPNYSRLLLEITFSILDTYEPVLGQSRIAEDLLKKIRVKLQDEVNMQSTLTETMGVLQLIQSNAC